MASDHESVDFGAPATPHEASSIEPPVDAPIEPELVVERLAPSMQTAAAREADEAPPPTDAGAAARPLDELSPAVRRLVRQYDLDVTGIRGTGPAGRIRVGDVIGLLGRGDGARSSEPTPFTEPRPIGAPVARTEERDDERPYRETPAAVATTVFECDLTRVLAHRRARRRDGSDVALTAYYLAACHDALAAVPEIAGAAGAAAALIVTLTSAEGDERSLHVPLPGSAAPLEERLLAFDRALREPAARPAAAALAIHHYGTGGCLLATPTPVAPEHAASVGIGHVRRQIVVRSNDGEEAPRVAALGYLTLSFRPERIALARANR
jgi:pyruvate/2-oxoglutarate dehydrogenase complex dihydrolipoamide acyltransferase (E2) component